MSNSTGACVCVLVLMYQRLRQPNAISMDIPFVLVLLWWASLSHTAPVIFDGSYCLVERHGLHIMRIAFVCTDVRYWPQLPSNARVAYIRRVHQQSFCLSAHFGWATLSALHLIIVCMRERYIFRDATLSPAIWRLVEIGYWFTAHVFSSVCSFFQYVCSLRPKAPHKMKRGNWNSIRADK